MIGWSGTNCTELEQADAYNLGMSHISSNFFLSDLLRALRKGFWITEEEGEKKEEDSSSILLKLDKEHHQEYKHESW